MVQPDSEGKRGRWIVKLLEYDLHINPTKMIKGQGLAKFLLESKCKPLQDVELKYDILEKQAYALVKALKAFRVYVL
jgi:hypothetical protein